MNTMSYSVKSTVYFRILQQFNSNQNHTKLKKLCLQGGKHYFSKNNCFLNRSCYLARFNESPVKNILRKKQKRKKKRKNKKKTLKRVLDFF